MKRHLSPLLFTALFSCAALLPFCAGAQQKTQQSALGCVDPAIRTQAETIKKHYTDQGFTLFRDAMISMSSMEPFPVIVQLLRDNVYEIVFIAHPGCSRLKMDILDGADNKIDERLAMRNHDQPNYIIYTFTPQQTDNYLFSVMQKMKNRDVCGSFFILKLDPSRANSEIIPYTGNGG